MSAKPLPTEMRATPSSASSDTGGTPVNVIVLPGVPPVSELAELGVARISVGSGFALTAYGALVEAGRELLEHGTYGFWEVAGKAHELRDAYR